MPTMVLAIPFLYEASIAKRACKYSAKKWFLLDSANWSKKISNEEIASALPDSRDSVQIFLRMCTKVARMFITARCITSRYQRTIVAQLVVERNEPTFSSSGISRCCPMLSKERNRQSTRRSAVATREVSSRSTLQFQWQSQVESFAEI